MRITVKDGTDPYKIIDLIHERINSGSRFTCEPEILGKTSVKIRNIRLKKKSIYCGSHPEMCDVHRGPNARWLQGLDWVHVNDLINDLIDELDCEANVYTSVCWLRKGRLRRTHYGSHMPSFGRVAQWNKDEPEEFYQDWCGKMAPNSTFPMGPGQYLREQKVDM